jgi:hypothetical protein
VYITTKYLGPTTNKGSRIQFSLVDNCKREYYKEFSYHDDAPANFTIPFKRTKYVTTLFRNEQTMIYRLEQYIAYLNKERGLDWKPTDFVMTRLESCQYIFTLKMHTIELGE